MTNTLIWQKGSGKSLDAAIQAFCAADDVVVDRTFFACDLRATDAHAAGLVQIGVLTADEGNAIHEALATLRDDFVQGRFVLDARYEDGQSAIEAVLIEKLGDTGRRVHTGRSRNDQVLVALRLWLKEAVTAAARVAVDAAEALLGRAATTASTPMPGYTHLQSAMPTSVGAWLAGHGEGLIDSVQALLAARDVVDASVLGTGSGFGVSLPLPREAVAQALQFQRVVVTAQAAQNSRGKIELFALQALHLATLDVRRLAWDLSLFQMAEFGFVRLPDAFTTGSSLMPNKRNPDVVELLRALPACVEGAMAELSSLLALPSSYHRDLQGTKAPVARAFSRATAGLALVPRLVEAMALNEVRMRGAISDDMYATDRALELVQQGVPFRDAYVRAATQTDATARTPEQSLAARVSLGGAGNLGLDLLQTRLQTLAQRI